MFCRWQMAGIVFGSFTPEQRIVLSCGASRSGFRKCERTTRFTHLRIRRGFPIPVVVVRRLGRGTRRRSTSGRPRSTYLRTESSQRPVLACSTRESLREVSKPADSNFLPRPSTQRITQKYATKIHSDYVSQVLQLISQNNKKKR